MQVNEHTNFADTGSHNVESRIVTCHLTNVTLLSLPGQSQYLILMQGWVDLASWLQGAIGSFIKESIIGWKNDVPGSDFSVVEVNPVSSR